MSNFVILKWRPFEYNASFEKKGLFYLGPKFFFDIPFEIMYKGTFKDL